MVIYQNVLLEYKIKINICGMTELVNLQLCGYVFFCLHIRPKKVLYNLTNLVLIVLL